MPLISKGYVLDLGLTDVFTEIVVENNVPLMCTLVNINLKENSNKFTVLHALKNDFQFFLYSRSGRLGSYGKTTFKQVASETKCIDAFKAKFKLLTANIWDMTKTFEHRKDHYNVFSLHEKAPDEIASCVSQQSLQVKKPIGSKDPVDTLIDLFCGKETYSSAICDIDFDDEKMPVGKISELNLENAKNILDELHANIGDWPEDKIIRFSEKYYGCIPAKFTGKSPKILNTQELIQKKIEDLEILKNLTLTIKLIEKGGNVKQTLYGSIGHQVRLLPTDDPIYPLLKNYFYQSHGITHKFKLNFVSVYEILNIKQKEIYEKKHGNSSKKELLIHGSRLCNWRSILEKGLMINPGNLTDKITGKMFGHGIYWANSFSKSAQYCSVHRNKEKICLALGEVAVGKQLEIKNLNITFNEQSLGDYDSVHGVGRYNPHHHEIFDGVHIPAGSLVCQHDDNAENSLIYDEKIIYDETQYYFRYLVIAEIN